MKDKLFFKKHEVTVPIYNQFKLVIVVTYDVDRFYSGVTNSENNLNKSEGLFFDNGEFIYICIKPTASNGLIAHECFHATAFVMDRIGCELKGESEEPYAYLLGWFVDEVYKFLDI